MNVLLSQTDLVSGAADSSYVSAEDYTRLYEASVNDPEAFWGAEGKRLDWIKPYTKVKDTSFAHDDVHIRWFADGTLNVYEGRLEVPLTGAAGKVALTLQTCSDTICLEPETAIFRLP